MKKIRVGVLFGGRSVEHDVSVTSAQAVVSHLDPQKYDVVTIGVTRKGKWLTARDARALLEVGPDRSTGTPVVLTADPSVRGLVPLARQNDGQFPVSLDVVFPLVHGTGGEDGTLQGLLELAGLPYVGAGVLGSSVGMDKAMMKRVFGAAGLRQAVHMVVTKARIERDLSGIRTDAAERIGFPCFTKPSNGGSSVGISKIAQADQLRAGLAEAAQYDSRVLIEQAVDGQEVECAVLGNDEPEVSVVGEIVPCNEFYDYRAKYVDTGSELIIPARIEPSQATQVQEISLAAFEAIGASGMARVDLFVRRADGAVLINEINTIPGFTPISMYPRLWAASGLDFSALVDRLIDLALERQEERSSLRREYTPGEEAPGGR